MPYYKMLNKVVSSTKYTQEEIANKCAELGINITRTYINKLLNNKLPSPKEEVSRAIAKVCNVDERLLVIEGYLDKAPKEIKETFITLKYLTMLSSLNILENSVDNKTLNELRKLYEEENLSDFIIELLDNGNIAVDTKEKGYELKLEKDNLIFSLTQPNAIKITDNAMYPLIKENDEVTFEIKDKNKYVDSDILLVKLNNEENITARQAIFLGNDVKLVPLNNKYISKLVHINDIKILGKVKKVITEI